MDANSVMLVGEAAKSWVELQWMDFYFGVSFITLFFIILFSGIGYIIYRERKN